MLQFRYVLLAVSVLSLTSAALQKVLLIIRHGDRTTNNPSFPTEIDSEFTNGQGNLTELGRTEGYELGIRLRTMYQTFLTNNTQEVRANSSGYARTIITTGCVLVGMYTPDDMETCMNGTETDAGWPVIVDSKPVSQDLVLCSDSCGRIDVEKQSNASIEADDQYFQQYNVTVEELANYTGYHNISEYATVYHTYDNLLVEKIHNLTWEYGWVDPMWPDILNAAYAAYHLQFITNELRKLSGGPFLNEIVQQIKDNNNATKLHLYGTHESNITPLLMLLGVDNGIPPPYTATLIVELHDNATVHLMYINSTGNPWSLQIPQCNMYCPVDQFVKLTSPFVVTDPWKECNGNGDDHQQTKNASEHLNAKNASDHMPVKGNGSVKLISATTSILLCLLVALFLL